MTRFLGKLVFALVLYLIWAYDLYHAHWSKFSLWQQLYVVNGIVGAAGLWVLSSRWVRGQASCWIAGAVYGLGPYCLYMHRFHPLAGALLASVPWLFCPVFHFDSLARRLGFNASQRSTRLMLKLWVATLPWGAIVGAFAMMVHSRRFVLPLQLTQSVWGDWASCFAPWALASQGRLVMGVYHVPLALSLMGLMVMLRARRWGPIGCLLLAVLLTLTQGLWQVSPLAWMSVFWVFVAVLCGVGADTLVTAGRSDLRWIVWAPVLQVTLAVLLLFAAGKYFQVLFGDGAAKVLLYCSRFYLLGAVSLGGLAVIVARRLRWRAIRWALILLPVGVDLFFSGRFLVDRFL